ncbi:hypothetical protein DL93DRAFT_1236563 [Clavulina sp. PMI_390]|nr:hypothetical protein DL93DRAFT_1236563 [Clavulina sp. PMI_390]
MSTEIIPISYPDGDIVLSSSDEVEHRVHSFILREASGFFRDMFESSKPDPDFAPIVLTESTDIINFILSHLYPRSSPPHKPPGHAVFTAVEKYRLDCYSITNALISYLDSRSHPLRAWALAVRYGYPAARKTAVRRYIQGSSDRLSSSGIPKELGDVPGNAVLKVVSIRKETVGAVMKLVKSIAVDNRCGGRMCLGWELDLESSINTGSLSLFDPYPTLVPRLKAIADEKCHSCACRVLDDKVSVVTEKIATLLDKAIENEAAP